MQTDRSLESTKSIKMTKSQLICISELGNTKCVFDLATALSDDLIISIKENKKHITYSLTSVEEKALYEFLRERNGRKTN